MSTLETVVAGSDAARAINDNTIALSAAGLYGRRAAGVSGLTWGYFGGRGFGNTIADGTVVLTASTTNYVVANRSTGVVSTSTSTTNWNDTTNYYRLYLIVTGGSTITTATDYREFVSGPPGGTFTGGTLTAALNEAPAVTLASASTVNVGAAAANTINISGTTTINAFDTIASGAVRRVIFAGILTLTYNATSMILPTAASITTAAGDVAEFVSLGSGNWKCIAYTRAAGTALAGSGGSFTGGTLTSALNEAPQVTIASAASVAIGAAAANTVLVSGIVTITSFDTIAAGAVRRVRFLGALILTHNATTLILPGSASITTAAGDVATMESLGSGNWRCVDYAKADGTPLVVGGGGLTGATSALNTAAPNATINISSITASGGTTNQAFAVVPKGTGPFQLAVSNSAASGGNTRGDRSVDLQLNRTVAASVASGVNSFLGGGIDGQASGQSSANVAGAGNIASGLCSGTFAGSSNTASGSNAVTLGGESLTASGDYSSATGFSSTASGNRSRVGGAFGTTRGIHMADVYGTGTVLGKHQREMHGLFINTASATPAVPVAFTGAASTSNQVTLQNNSAMTFIALVTAKKSGSTDSASYKVEGAAVRGASAATTAIVGTPTVTTIGAAAGASGWVVAVTADTTIGCLTFTVTGGAYSVEWDVQVIAGATVLA